MHPFFRSAKNILAAGLSWLSICFGVITVNFLITSQSFLESSILLAPAMVMEFLVCISIWYICRTFSLRKTNFIITIAKHIASMILLLTVWLLIINIYCNILDQLFNINIWQNHYRTSMPLLFSIGFFIYFLSCLFYYLVINIEQVQKTEQQILEQKFLTAQAKIKSLKAMIQPHFLFNSLTALSKLTVSDSERAREVCLRLSDFYRYNLRYSQKDIVTVNDEIKHVENYLNIEKIRFGHRLNVRMHVDNIALTESVLSLTLLTLIENAIKHGIQQCVEGGTVSISIQKEDRYLNIAVSNPYDIQHNSQEGEGFGITTLKQRMYAHYGDNADLKITRGDKFFYVTLKIPVHD